MFNNSRYFKNKNLLLSRQNRYALCDVCGFQYHIKDLIKVNAPRHQQHNLLVCRRDLDKLNPQTDPIGNIADKLLTNTDKVRVEVEDGNQAVNLDDDRLPSKPLFGKAVVDPIQDKVTLYWEGPYDSGTSAIIGYKVVRSEPPGGPEDILTLNTENGSPYYFDSSSDTSATYTYRVAAVTALGTGPYSDYIFWPIETPISDVIYILTEDNKILSTEDGTYIIL